MTRKFDRQTVQVLRDVLEDAAKALPKGAQRQQTKVLLASRILEAAAAGERDPVRLSAAALGNPPPMQTRGVPESPERPLRCQSCDSETRLVFRGPNPLRFRSGEIREYHCPTCGARTTRRWPPSA